MKENTLPVYNNKRTPLLMPEYGRTIQTMIEKAAELPTKAQRQACAQYIVSVMSKMHDSATAQPDLEERMWNHLAQMSQYRLDIDYPIKITPQTEVGQFKPSSMSYPMKQIHRKHYGHLTEMALQYLTNSQDDAECEALRVLMANQMHQNLYTWNHDSMDGKIVRHDIQSYTKGKFDIDEDFKFAPIVQEDSLILAGKNKKKKKNNNNQNAWRPF